MLSALAKDRARAYSTVNSPFYDLKPSFPRLSSVGEKSPGNPLRYLQPRGKGRSDLCVYGQTALPEWIFVLNDIFWLNAILNNFW